MGDRGATTDNATLIPFDRALAQQRIAMRVFLVIFLPVYLYATISDLNGGNPVELAANAVMTAMMLVVLVTRIARLSPRREYVLANVLTIAFVAVFGAIIIYMTYFAGEVNRSPWAYLFVILAVYTLKLRIGVVFGLLFLAGITAITVVLDPVSVSAEDIVGLKHRYLLSLVITFAISIIAVAIWNKTLAEVNRKKEELAASLRRNETLLQEIHHRVKNNMQIVSSLLNLEKNRIADESVAARFANSEERVRTIALVHESLYNTETFAAVNLREYLNDLSGLAVSAFSDPESRITVESAIPDLYVDLKTAVPMGLMFNELITNAVQHAFPATRGGNLTFGFRKKGDAVVVTFSDNGVGEGDWIRDTGPDSLGLSLVHSLAEQLGATATCAVGDGTTWTIEVADHLFADSPEAVEVRPQ